MRRSTQTLAAGATSRSEPLFSAKWPIGGAAVRGQLQSRVRIAAFGPDIAFLAKRGVPERILGLAAQLAAVRGTAAREELFAAGFQRRRYWEMLADELGLQFLPDLAGAEFLDGQTRVTAAAVRSATSLMVRLEGRMILLRAPAPCEIAPLAARLQQVPALSQRICICEPETIRAFLLAHRRSALSHYAVNRLARILPRFSARHLGSGRGAEGPVSLVCATFGLCLADPTNVIAVLLLAFSLFFANCGVWKLAATLSRPRRLRLEPVPVGQLPTYTVLVPLYREAKVIPDLLQRLTRLDYPALCIKRTKRPDNLRWRGDRCATLAILRR